MPRSKSSSPRSEQLLLRLTADELEVLEVVAHLERRTVNSYVYGLVQAHVQTLRTNEFVRTDLENRRRYQASSAQTTQLFGHDAEEHQGNGAGGATG